MGIEANIKARRLADDALTLIIELLAESRDNRGGDFGRRFWRAIAEAATKQAGDSPAASGQDAAAQPAMTDEESRRFGQTPMRFGKHAGDRIDDVPIDYLIWLAEYQRNNFKDDLRRYVQSRRVQAEL